MTKDKIKSCDTCKWCCRLDNQYTHCTSNGMVNWEPKPTKGDDMCRNKILRVCFAYEQGFGHGLDQRGLPNPYKNETDEWIAWDYGYSEGNRKNLASGMNK